MTDKEIEHLSLTDDEVIDRMLGMDLEVAYAEQVLGYEYHPGKTERKPWHRRMGGVSYPCMETLPHFLGWDCVLDCIRTLTDLTQQWPFKNALKAERFSVYVTFDERSYEVSINLLTDGGNSSNVITMWEAEGHPLGEAFLRAMLKAAAWFRSERGWEPR